MSESSVEHQVHPGAQQGVKEPGEIHQESLANPAAPPVEVEALEESGPQPVANVTVTLETGVEIRVPVQSTWKRSAMDYMQIGDFDSWAELVLTKEDLGHWDEWMHLDPTMGEITKFFERVGKATGEAAGGNRASRRASARMRNR